MVHFLLGQKCTMYSMLLSVWGVIMLTIMGIIFKIRSPLLYDSICFKKECEEWKNGNFTREQVHFKYDDCAYNCWIAAVLYAVLFVTAFIVHKWNSRLNVGN